MQLLLVALLAMPARPAQEAREERLEIRVVDEYGAPAAGARVFALGMLTASNEYSRLSHLEDDRVMVDIVMRLGESVVADATGKAIVASTESTMHFVASKGEGFASRRSDEFGDEGKVLTLQHDQHLTVQVLDAAGVPRSRVPVALYRSFGESDFSIYQPGGSAWSRPTRGEDGTITIEHIQCYIGRGKLGLAIPQREFRFVDIDLDSLPRDKVILRLPQTGSVLVKMAEAPESFAQIRTLPPEDAGRDWHGIDSFWSNYSPTHATFEHGIARFPFVETGLELQIKAWWKGAETAASFVHAGPRKPGEELVIEIDEKHGPGGLVIGASDVVVLAGQDVLQPRLVLITAVSFDNDRFDMCFVPDDMREPDHGRNVELRIGKDRPSSRGWHGIEADPIGHFAFRGLDERQAKLASEKFGAPIARLGARPYRLQSSFTLDKPTYSPRNQVQLRLRAENIGERPFAAHFGGWQRGANRHGRFEFTIVKDGRTLPDIGTSISFGGLSSAVLIKPHDHFEEQAQLDQWCAFEQPGIYEVDARFELHVTETELDFECGEPCVVLAENIIDFVRGHARVVVK